MLDYIASVFFGLLSSLLILSSRNSFSNLAIHSLGLLDALLIHNKDEKFVMIIEKKLKQATYSVFIFLIYLASIFVIIGFGLYINNKNIFVFWIFYLLGSLIPFFLIRFIFPKKSDYNFLSQLLHRLILSNYNLGRWLLLKQIRKVLKSEIANQKSIIITGLARSGTTALTKMLSERGNLFSLDYSNMPFLMYPRLWRRFYKPKNVEAKERIHRDGINVGLSSVEALEEYFFKVELNDSYVLSDGLVPHLLSEVQIKKYITFQASLSKGKTYLAKNNNHILRINSLIKFNANSFIFILFRDPIEHAFSLFNQHQSLCKLQVEDSFIVEYMDWLGHYEFGINHKPFLLHNNHFVSCFSPMSIEYWIEIWINYYSFALNIEGVTFLSYDDFLKSPSKILNFVSIKSGENINLQGLEIFEKKKNNEVIKNEELENRAREIYLKLVQKTSN